MKFNIQTLNAQGRRDNNEDSILASPDKGLFMACDGVGGSQKGEVASDVACKSIQQYFRSVVNRPGTGEDIESAIALAEANMDSYVAQNPGSAGMATTLTLLYFAGPDALAAHIGDSRIYHVRDGEILFKTFDHSLVNELLATGSITEEEARTHPRKNVITRALQGGSSPAVATIKKLSGLQNGDFFLLCTDGILESITDGYLSENLVSGADILDIITEMDNLCAENSRDNYSAILIRIEDEGADGGYIAPPAPGQNRSMPAPANPAPVSPQRSPLTRILMFIILILCGGLGYYLWKMRHQIVQPPPVSQHAKSKKATPNHPKAPASTPAKLNTKPANDTTSTKQDDNDQPDQ